MKNMPTQKTLDKYGLSEAEYQTLYDQYSGACHICKKVPSTGRLNVDHDHVRGWSKLPPEKRKQYVRGLLCFVCNHRLLSRGITIEKLTRAIEYLREFDKVKIGLNR